MEAGLRSAYALNRHVSQLCIASSHFRRGAEHTRMLQSTKADGIITRIARSTGGQAASGTETAGTPEEHT